MSRPFKKIALTAAAFLVGLGASATASAGKPYGRHGAYGGGYVVTSVRHGHYHGRYYRPGVVYYGGPRFYHGHRYPHYRYSHGRGLSGGEAALIAAGIIGGIILIDRALERERYAYAYDDRRYAPPPRSGDYYYRRDDRLPPYGDGDDLRFEGGYGDELDRDLLGRAPGRGPVGDARPYNYGRAYADCKAETREAARAGGLFVSLPARPERIEPIEDGEAVRFTASFLAQDRRGGGEYRRTLVCEADEGGVRFLELV